MIWNNPPKFVPIVKSGKKITPESLAKTGTEDGLQAALFCWAADNVSTYPQLKWLFAVPNGGFRNKPEAVKLVATGTRSGVPDVFLPWPSSFNKLDSSNDLIYSGCWIENKIEKYRNRKNGGCDDEQLAWHEYLRSAGYYVAVCYSWEEGRDVLINYLEGRL